MLNAKFLNPITLWANDSNYCINKEIKTFISNLTIEALFKYWDYAHEVHLSSIIIKNKKEFEFYEKFEKLLQKRAKKLQIILR